MDAEQKWFSLIVPVYNVDKYLKFCLASIEEQDFDDYELILIDDGSTDNSGAVCDFYASNHKNVKVLHQKNGGLSSARNAGLRLANGKYVIFIDSDDYIAHGTLRKFHDVTEKNPVDIVAAYGYKMIAEGQCVKREDFRKAFDNFDIEKICKYDEEKIKELLSNEKIVRNKLKINASINNSKIFKEIQNEYGSFGEYLKLFTNGKIIYETEKTTSKLSDDISKDLKNRGMKFVGSTIIYSYLQAIGVIYSHEKECFMYLK